MVNESRTFGAAAALTVAGLLVMLYGVYLDSGLAMNAPMVVGGTIIVVATTVLTVGIGAIPEESDAESSH